MTVVAESNDVLAKAGYSSYAALKARFSKTGKPASVNDSLNIYIGYHIITDAKYLGDIISASSHLTKVATEPTVVSAKLDDQAVLLNDDVFNGVREPGIELIRAAASICFLLMCPVRRTMNACCFSPTTSAPIIA